MTAAIPTCETCGALDDVGRCLAPGSSNYRRLAAIDDHCKTWRAATGGTRAMPAEGLGAVAAAWDVVVRFANALPIEQHEAFFAVASPLGQALEQAGLATWGSDLKPLKRPRPTSRARKGPVPSYERGTVSRERAAGFDAVFGHIGPTRLTIMKLLAGRDGTLDDLCQPSHPLDSDKYDTAGDAARSSLRVDYRLEADHLVRVLRNAGVAIGMGERDT
jgi:hypothetical protein